MSTATNPVTLAQAKRRWNSHTRHVISNEARRLAKISLVWHVTDDGKLPTIWLGTPEAGQIVLGFEWQDEARGFIRAYQIA